MEQGRRLSENTVSSVVHLVASSVDGLMPEEVTVVDASGRILARGGDEYGGIGSGLEQQRKFEQSLEERVTRMVERVVGMGRATFRLAQSSTSPSVNLPMKISTRRHRGSQ